MSTTPHRSDTATAPPESGFVGDVRIEDYVRRPAPSRLVGATVVFGRGARTPWKVNELGQTVVVTQGVGRAGTEEDGVIEIAAGDVLWFPPGQRHWEGAAPDSTLAYAALQEEVDTGVQFLGAVTDAEYALPAPGPSSKRGPGA